MTEKATIQVERGKMRGVHIEGAFGNRMHIKKATAPPFLCFTIETTAPGMDSVHLDDDSVDELIKVLQDWLKQKSTEMTA